MERVIVTKNRFRKVPKRETDRPGFPFTLFSALILGYVTICGTLWHLGYWSTFGFNYLEYVQLSDLFKSTIYPFFSRSWIMLSLFVFSFGGAFGMLVFLRVQNKKRNKPVDQPTRFDYTSYSKDLMVIDSLIYFSISIGGMLLVTRGSRRATVAVPLIAAGFGFILVRQRFLQSNFKDDLLRTIFILSLTLYAGFNFTLAKQSAVQALIHFKYRKITEIKSDEPAIDMLLIHQPYLGATDKFTFVLVNSDNVIVVNNDKIKYLVLQDFTDPTKYKEWEDQ